MSPGREAHEEGALPTSGLYAASDEPSGLRQLERCEPLHGPAEPQNRRGGRRTQPVGRYTAIGNGMYDVYGNAWELTSDCWSDGYLNNSDPAKRGKADCSRRVAKGGGWFSSQAHLNLAIRVGVRSGFANNGLGFRVLREGGQQRAANSRPVKASSAKARQQASMRTADMPVILSAGSTK